MVSLLGIALTSICVVRRAGGCCMCYWLFLSGGTDFFGKLSTIAEGIVVRGREYNTTRLAHD